MRGSFPIVRMRIGPLRPYQGFDYSGGNSYEQKSRKGIKTFSARSNQQISYKIELGK
jgi:hypothetical protein